MRIIPLRDMPFTLIDVVRQVREVTESYGAALESVRFVDSCQSEVMKYERVKLARSAIKDAYEILVATRDDYEKAEHSLSHYRKTDRLSYHVSLKNTGLTEARIRLRQAYTVLKEITLELNDIEIGLLERGANYLKEIGNTDRPNLIKVADVLSQFDATYGIEVETVGDNTRVVARLHTPTLAQEYPSQPRLVLECSFNSGCEEAKDDNDNLDITLMDVGLDGITAGDFAYIEHFARHPGREMGFKDPNSLFYGLVFEAVQRVFTKLKEDREVKEL